jgi:hypothetical protein
MKTSSCEPSQGVLTPAVCLKVIDQGRLLICFSYKHLGLSLLECKVERVLCCQQ